MNPTFYVANPEEQVTDDSTSPTIRLLHQSGFSSENAFIFDQVCRRERTEDLLYFYTDEFYYPHREFVKELRRNMAAIVEICWGDSVWGEIERELGSRLIPFPLWGKFKAVKLYLELDESIGSLRRFILRVRHPQFFVRSGLNKLGPEARKKYGESQDLALTVARQLVGDGKDSTVNYFQTRFPLKQGNRMTHQQEELYDGNHQLALQALRKVFPERYQRRANREQKLRKADEILQDIKKTFRPMITFKREEFSQSALVITFHIHLFNQGH